MQNTTFNRIRRLISVKKAFDCTFSVVTKGSSSGGGSLGHLRRDGEPLMVGRQRVHHGLQDVADPRRDVHRQAQAPDSAEQFRAGPLVECRWLPRQVLRWHDRERRLCVLDPYWLRDTWRRATTARISGGFSGFEQDMGEAIDVEHLRLVPGHQGQPGYRVRQAPGLQGVIHSVNEAPRGKGMMASCMLAKLRSR